MRPTTQIAIAIIGALGILGGSWVTASSAADAQVAQLDTKVQLVERTQTLQYDELKDSVTTIQQDVKEILRAVK